MKGKLAIVILNFNLKDDTIELLHSLCEAGIDLDQIILIDNGSSDGSIDAFRREFDGQLQIVENQQNTGFAGGNNQGFALAVNRGAEWVLLLNNDTIAPSDFLKYFFNTISEEHSYQIYSPVIYYYSNPEIIWHMGAYAIPGTLLGLNRYRGKKLPGNLNPISRVDYISGCAMFIHVDVYKKIRLFDPRFFAYWEEIDFCYRARKAGFNIGVISNCKLLHKVSLTAKNNSAFQRYYYTRNMFYYFRKNSKGILFLLMTLFGVIKVFLQIFNDVLSNQTNLILPSWRGFLHGLKGPKFSSTSTYSMEI